MAVKSFKAIIAGSATVGSVNFIALFAHIKLLRC